jgi:hypothetical protein
MQFERVTPVLRIFDVALAKSFFVSTTSAVWWTGRTAVSRICKLHSKGHAFMNPGLDPGPGERMLSVTVIDPSQTSSGSLNAVSGSDVRNPR